MIWNNDKSEEYRDSFEIGLTHRDLRRLTALEAVLLERSEGEYRDDTLEQYWVIYKSRAKQKYYAMQRRNKATFTG